MELTVWTDDLECEVCPVTRGDVVSPVIPELWARLVLLVSGRNRISKYCSFIG